MNKRIANAFTHLIPRLFLVLTGIALMLVGCTKEEGEGGLASIRGRVLVKDYNSTFTQLEDEYYAQDEEVFIIYGDDVTVGESVQTNYDGWFEFPWLRPGHYTIFCYSDDSTLQTLAKIPIIKEVEIQKRKEIVSIDDIVIFN